MPDGQRVMVVADETAELLSACRGAALLLDLLDTQQLANEDQEREVPQIALSIMNIAMERMKLLVRALRDGEAGILIAEFNSALQTAHLKKENAVLLPMKKTRQQDQSPVTAKRGNR